MLKKHHAALLSALAVASGTAYADCSSPDITTGTTGTLSGALYLDAGPVYISGMLRIESGSTIYGCGPDSNNYPSQLVVTRQGELWATDVTMKPDGSNWGGLVLLGNAPSTAGTDIEMEFLQGFGDPELNRYGGNDANHNCGRLIDVLVQNAGAGDPRDINAVTFGGCGSLTFVSGLTVEDSGDDGVEMFGGGFPVHETSVLGAADDGIDWDEGFNGTIVLPYVDGASASAYEASDATNILCLPHVGQANGNHAEWKSGATITIRNGNLNPDAFIDAEGTASFSDATFACVPSAQ